MGFVEKKLKEVLAFAACLRTPLACTRYRKSSDAHELNEHNGQDVTDAPCKLNGWPLLILLLLTT